MQKIIALLAVAFGLLALASCKSKGQTVAADPDVYYTCSMDPQVVEAKPGKCPICHMELTAVHKSSQAKDDEILLSPQQMQLGNIRLDTMRDASAGGRMVLTGTMAVDASKTAAVSARVAGRVEHLYVRDLGAYIKKGQKLYDLYSEELNNAEQEYRLLLQKRQALGTSVVDFTALIESARNKLLLWGLSDAQMKDLEDGRGTGAVTAFYSPVSGTVTELGVKEGDYVAEGGAVVRVADLSTLWVEAQVYASELSGLDRNAMATVQVPDLPGREMKGRIAFVNPEINPDTRIDEVRVEVANTDHLLRAGMPAYVTILATPRKTMTLPSDAVLRSAGMSVVWVQTKENTFTSRMVEIGDEADGQVEMRSGLHIGDVVVVSGAYLVQSEYIFRKGADPMAGMKM
ncbi:MAG TPA: efflux RND transporter periplasmic adaptor subunit [Puia sp.]|jgi:Cu(I)/Ag(I) efflux system membrane fusion protein